MKYFDIYVSPIGIIQIESDDNGITGIRFIKKSEIIVSNTRNIYIEEVKNWLDVYFSGINPDFIPHLNMQGTDFQKRVWEILKNIPYGKTITYKAIASEIKRKCGAERMSAQAVGGAVAKNPVLIVVPCHRVIGSDGKLTGYSAGINIKEKLLKLEKYSIQKEIAANLYQ